MPHHPKLTLRQWPGETDSYRAGRGRIKERRERMEIIHRRGAGDEKKRREK